MTPYTVSESIDPDAYPELAEYTPLTRKLLIRRGITTAEEADKFLNPDYERDIFDPFLIKGMDKAVARIITALENNERIAIYGDYDCDGIPGSVVLHDALAKIGYRNFFVYIPDRHIEGYGLNTEAIDALARDNVTLLITIDCGISDVDEIAHANDLGIETIITDHHLTQEHLPPAYAILNSKQEDCAYPDEMLCGAGVAWKLSCALFQTLKEEEHEYNPPPVGWEKWLLDMAGLSTVADMVPLVGENRTLAHYGLKVLRKSPRPGLQKLLSLMRINQKTLNEDDIGFMIAPRINAASRMGTPKDAFEMLAEDNPAKAGALAEKLHQLNEQRKLLVARIVKEAKQTLRQRELRDVIVVGNPNWRIGVLGIAATNLVEEFRRPVFVWGREGGTEIKGSCRSDGSVNVLELMTAAGEELFLGLGGHEASGGFSISQHNVYDLEDRLVEAYAEVCRQTEEEEHIVDAELTPEEVTPALAEEIQRLSPFGMGNPKPLFLFSRVPLAGVKKFGKKNDHLELQLARENMPPLPAISFFTNEADRFSAGDRVSILAHIEISHFRNRPEIRLRTVEIE